MRVGNVFSHVCLCVCVSVCLSVHPSIHLSVRFYVSHTVVQAGGLHSTEMRSCLALYFWNRINQALPLSVAVPHQGPLKTFGDPVLFWK